MIELIMHYCMLQPLMEAHLKKQFNEERVAIGLDEGGRRMELFASPNGTWTIIIVNTEKQACVLLSGDSYSAITPSKDL